MKKILYFVVFSVVCIFDAGAASRTEIAPVRTNRAATTTTERTPRSTTGRNAVKTTVVSRGAKNVSVLTPRTTKTQSATRVPVTRSATKTVLPRATETVSVVSETRTGLEYERCKSAFFTCMDQFCELKNDSFKRCSCNNRVFDFQDVSANYQDVNERLTEFSENLDVVGMSYDQAIAMKTATEGEDALAEDKSASRQLLQAIMNSIKGDDATVGGKYKDLNSLTVSADMSNAFGMDDSGQIIASYNGTALYKAVYPKCRDAVHEDCNSASLQRAVNAYLMAIEQDCNSVETALVAQQKSLKAATHQSSAMLDLARVENRRKHNADDVAACIANVEKSIVSEEVCGSDYHKCLDNGQFIDVTTGAPLTGVVNFAELGNILTFNEDKDIKDQKLSTIQKNRQFVKFFENKTKKFAKDALDKCVEDADFVWQEYLDSALLSIYYAQQAKVKEIKQSCFTLVANCYDNQNTSVADAMANLTGDATLLLKPAAISLTTKMCSDYIDSCNGMFGDNIIQDYIAAKNDADNLNACRAIAQQCFDKFGGTRYSNFYSPQNGLFKTGEALDWFSLYAENSEIVSPCAKQISETVGCEDLVEQVFGGFDKCVKDNNVVYSTSGNAERAIRPSGVATEVYYKILDNLTTQCAGLNGYFVEYKYATQYGYDPNDFCKINSDKPESVFYKSNSRNQQSLTYWYHFIEKENMCPANYGKDVDTQSWGMCSCWENGGFRSKNGTISACRPLLRIMDTSNAGTFSEEDVLCSENVLPGVNGTVSGNSWCQQLVLSSTGQVCPTMTTTVEASEEDGGQQSENNTTKSEMFCSDKDDDVIQAVKNKVPAQNRK